MRRWLRRLVVAAALAGAYFALRATVLAPEPVVVRVVAVERGRVEATVANSRAGSVRARRRALLSPEIGGLALEVPHRAGARVERGALLLRLEDRIQRAQLVRAQAQHAAATAAVQEAEVQLRQAERELERNRALAGKGLISDDVLERYQSALEAARAALATAQARQQQAAAEVALAEAELARTELRAPFAGVLAEVRVEIGEWVTPAPPLVPVPGVIDLIDTSSIYISAPMDEVHAAVLRAGLPARVTLDPYPGRSFEGRLVRVAAYVLDVETQNRTLEVEVELDDRAFAEQLLPGTSADVEVILQVRDDALRIPTAAIMEGERVLVLAAGQLHERRIETGLRNWSFTEVRRGLGEGELVVTSLGRPEVQAGVAAVALAESPAP
ncbi:MAG: MexH family multidrug efflux RND transporter periplasmic adaptor subunit [Planctomycetota bacterium]|nr:MAG: MexH family multidrug efflux RND transporter periplasmic adaptor subunit [Planctomycetota bacterium]